MSGECDKCAEHCTECKCKQTVDDPIIITIPKNAPWPVNITTKPAWISVKDKLPVYPVEDDCTMHSYLITDGKEISIGYHECEYKATDPNEPCQYCEARWHDDAGFIMTDYAGYPNVTHWMPLPEIPTCE